MLLDTAFFTLHAMEIYTLNIRNRESINYKYVTIFNYEIKREIVSRRFVAVDLIVFFSSHNRISVYVDK